MLDKEIGRSDIDGEQRIEILDRCLLDGRHPGDAGVGDEDVKPLAGDAADFACQFGWPVGRGEIGADRMGSAARGAICSTTASASATFLP